MVYTPVPNRKAAEALAESVIQERLAGCVNILGPSRSIYVWDGDVKRESEYILLLKTTTKRAPALEKRLSELHPYDCPCIARIKLESVHKPYLKWLVNSVR